MEGLIEFFRILETSWTIWGWTGEGGGRTRNTSWGELAEGWDTSYLSSKGEIEVASTA